MILKIAAQHAQGKTPLFFFTDKQNGTFNMFDFGIVAVSYVFIVSGVNGGSLITVLRLLRLLKIATRMPQLRTILLGLVAGVTAVGSILVLLSLITYLSQSGPIFWWRNEAAITSNNRLYKNSGNVLHSLKFDYLTDMLHTLNITIWILQPERATITVVV